MPYTLLQTLNHLSASRRGRWDLSLEFPESPTPPKPKPKPKSKSKFKSKSSRSSSPSPSKISKPSSSCRLRAYRGTTLSQRGKHRSRKRERECEQLLMIFKVTGPGRNWNWYGENENCGMPRMRDITCGRRDGVDLRPDALERGGGCEFCGMFIDIFVEDLESDISSLRSRKKMDCS